MFFINNLMAFYQRQSRNRNLFENQMQVHDDELISFLKENGGNHASHLIFLKDKEQFWTKDQNALIVYKQIFNKLVVLGDPIGEESNIDNAIKEFNEYCKMKNLKPVFYQTSPRYMQHYHDAGFRFVKLGEEANVTLSGFSIEGKKGAKLRTRINKFSRNGFTFRVVEPPHAQNLLKEIKGISDSWLGEESEKGFSVVSFREDYVCRFPIALLHNPEGKIIAFATLATDYKHTLTIDLMRKCKQSPHGTMDVLFLQIFAWAKDNGYLNCSLGMAPLANVGNCQHSFSSEKIIRLVYLYGSKKYNFKGLREFKSKFATEWEPKYLAYKKSVLPIVFIQLVFLINLKQSTRNQVDKGSIVKRIGEKLALNKEKVNMDSRYKIEIISEKFWKGKNMLLCKDLFQRFIKYSFVGLICTCIYFLSVFILVERFHFDPVIGSAFAFIIMTIVSFFMNIRYTFGSNFTFQKLLRFLIVSIIGFTLNFLLMYLIVHILSYHYLVGELVTILVIPIVNFLLNNYWTFQSQL